MKERSLAELKDEYGALYVLRIDDVLDIGSISFIFRLLTVSEYKTYKNIFTSRPHTLTAIEDEVFEKCVVKSMLPTDISQDWIDHITEGIPISENTQLDVMDFLPAGITYCVFNAILYLSYPKSLQQWNAALDYERYRQFYDVESKTKSFLCAVLGYKPKELDKMTFKELSENIVLAESIVQFRPEVPLVFIDPEEAEAQRNKKKVSVEDFEKDAANLTHAIGGTYGPEEERLENLYAEQPKKPQKDPKTIYDELEKKKKRR